MAKRSPSTDISRNHYAALSRSPLYSLATITPILVFCHVAAALTHPNVADTPLVLLHMGRVFRRAGPVAPYLPAIAVVVVLFLQHLAHKDKWAVYPSVIGCMLVESALWLLPLVALLHVAGALHVAGTLAAQTHAPASIFDRVLLGVAAGVYEEFVFRLVLIDLILLLLLDVLALGKGLSAGLAVAVTAIAFGLYHPNALQIGGGQWAAEWWLLLFYVIGGAYLGLIYLKRGLGIVVGAHCLFNVYVVLIRGPQLAT